MSFKTARQTVRPQMWLLHSEPHRWHSSAIVSSKRTSDLGFVAMQPVNERLRLLGGTAKLALDLLEYDTSLERAFVTVCG